MAAPKCSISQYLETTIPEWKDDDKCLALFSSFRGSISENTENWMYKINFWYPLIIHTAFAGYLNSSSIFTFDIANLNNAFKRKGVSPLGIPTIISFQQQKGGFYTIEEYFSTFSFTNQKSFLRKCGNLVKQFLAIITPFETESQHILNNENFPTDLKFVVIDNVLVLLCFVNFRNLLILWWSLY